MPHPISAHSTPDAARTAIILCNLGTPAAATAAGVRPWLAQFLSDPRVVELPRALWLPILYGAILPFRPGRSAEKYARIWRGDIQSAGSPLMHYSQIVAEQLDVALSQSGSGERAVLAMRYGEPALSRVLDQLQQAHTNHLVLLPMYPQYSCTTTASVIDVLARWLPRQRVQPHVRIIRDFHAHPAYIAALKTTVQAHWQAQGMGDYLLMSFHGVPERTVTQGAPYRQHCETTAHLLAQALGLAPHQWGLSFQSRFGKAKWLEPATDTCIKQLAQQGKAHVQVLCPGFVSDCLETLEEIGLEGQEIFHANRQHATQQYSLIPCLNDHPAWIQALVEIVAPASHSPT